MTCDFKRLRVRSPDCGSVWQDAGRRSSFFEKMLGYANHLGLYGEELGPQAQHLGNFPQAFTHLALISAAFDLGRHVGRRPRRVSDSPVQ